MELCGSVVAITGGSRGFGLAIARHLVERGAKVGLLARRRESLAEAVALLGEAQALGLVADVADRAELTGALQSVKSHFGRFDALVNNAGLARPNSIEHLVEDQVALQVNTNFLGTVYASQAAIPLLRGAPDPRAAQPQGS